jgi:hypothetical protein
MTTAPKPASCGTCTLQLVTIAYRRAPWFRLLREPLIAGMRYFALIHRVDVSGYKFPVSACNGCIRFYKAELLRRSATFRWLHKGLNPFVDYFLEGKIVTEKELSDSKAYARAATKGTLSQKEIDDWMKGMKRVGLFSKR